MPLLDSIRGRTVNLFRTADGDVVDGSYMTRQLYGKPWCKQFQVVQEDYTRIRIKVVLYEGTSFEKDIGPISRAIKNVMGENCGVVFEEVDYIAPTESGKFLHTISMVGRDRGVGSTAAES
jgi:phenylacetate-CoA ligase